MTRSNEPAIIRCGNEVLIDTTKVPAQFQAILAAIAMPIIAGSAWVAMPVTLAVQYGFRCSPAMSGKLAA